MQRSVNFKRSEVIANVVLLLPAISICWIVILHGESVFSSIERAIAKALAFLFAVVLMLDLLRWLRGLVRSLKRQPALIMDDLGIAYFTQWNPNFIEWRCVIKVELKTKLSTSGRHSTFDVMTTGGNKILRINADVMDMDSNELLSLLDKQNQTPDGLG